MWLLVMLGVWGGGGSSGSSSIHLFNMGSLRGSEALHGAVTRTTLPNLLLRWATCLGRRKPTRLRRTRNSIAGSVVVVSCRQGRRGCRRHVIDVTATVVVVVVLPLVVVAVKWIIITFISST